MGCVVSSAAVTPSICRGASEDVSGPADATAPAALDKSAAPGQGKPSDRPTAPSPPRNASEAESTSPCSISALAAENIVAAAAYGRFIDNYGIGGVLGAGSFATVRLCSNQAGDQFAVKIVKLSGQASTRVLYSRMSVRRSDSAWRERLSGRSPPATKEELDDLAASDKLGDLKYLWREIETMKDLSHPHIIRFHGLYLSSTAARVYLVMQYLPGGELLGVLQKKGRFDEDEAHRVMVPVLKALEYLHARGIVHRDIKLENLMLQDASDLSSVKLCDFGLAKFTHEGAIDGASFHLRRDLMSTLCGTRVYMPPELVQRQRGACAPPADVWSVGIAFFTMLTGRLPFSPAKDQDGGYERIWRNIVSWNPRNVVETSSSWAHISSEAKELLIRMTEAAPRKRCSAADALADPWVRRRCPQGAAAAGPSGSGSESLVAAVAQSPQGGLGGAPSSQWSRRASLFSLTLSPNSQLAWAQKCLSDLALAHGHAPTLFTRGDWLVGAPPAADTASSASAAAAASPSTSTSTPAVPRESVLLVTRGELEVAEVPTGGMEDSAITPQGASHNPRRRITGGIATRVECSAPGLILAPTSLLLPTQLAPAGTGPTRNSTRNSAGNSLGTITHVSEAGEGGAVPGMVAAGAATAPVEPPQLGSPASRGAGSLAFGPAPSFILPLSAPMTVRVCSSSAEVIAIPADLVLALFEKTEGLAQTLRGEAGPHFASRAIVLLGVGKETTASARAVVVPPAVGTQLP